MRFFSTSASTRFWRRAATISAPASSPSCVRRRRWGTRHISLRFCYLRCSPLLPKSRVGDGCPISLAVFAILLSGTRAAILGLIAGAALVAIRRTGSFSPRKASALLIIGVAGLAIFYASPPGAKLRARVHWSGEDSLEATDSFMARHVAYVRASSNSRLRAGDVFQGSFLNPNRSILEACLSGLLS